MPRSVPFATFADEVLSLYAAPMRRQATRAKIAQVLAELSQICGKTGDLTPAAVSQWLAVHPDRSVATHRSLLSSLRAAYRYGAHRGWIANPFDFRPLAKWLPADELAAVAPFRRHRTCDEIRRILRQSDCEVDTWKRRRLRAAVYCWAYTGAGKTEILGLRACDLDIARGVLTIQSHPRRRLKCAARAARLPIVSSLGPVLREWASECGSDWLFPHTELSGPWFHGRPGYRPLDQVKALGHRAGVEGLTILAFRHSFATMAEGCGVGELGLQRLLRHARPQTQLFYRHEELEQLRRAAELIRYDDGASTR